MATRYETSYTPLVAEFEQDLDVITEGCTYELPDISDRVRHDGIYTYVEGFAPGFYVDPSFGAYGRATRFSLRPARRLSHEDSRHQVYFGDLYTAEQAMPIAVKTMPEHDLGELAIMQLFRKEGLPTFRPLGYLVSSSGASDGRTRGHLLTMYKQGIEPIASMDWRELTDDEKWHYVGYAVDTMRLLHPLMLFHTDLHFRNVAIDKKGELIVPDLEHTVSMRDAANRILSGHDDVESERLLEAITRKLSAEFTDVTRSVGQFVFSTTRPRINDPSAQFKRLRPHVFDRYRDQVQGESGVYVGVLLKAYDRMLAKKKEQVRRGIF